MSWVAKKPPELLSDNLQKVLYKQQPKKNHRKRKFSWSICREIPISHSMLGMREMCVLGILFVVYIQTYDTIFKHHIMEMILV